MSAVSEFSMPSDPEDVKKIKNAIIDASAQKQMIADRQEALKDIKSMLKEEFGMPAGLFNKLVKAHFDHKYEELSIEHSVFETLYETLFDSDTTSDDEDEDEEDDD